MIPPDRAGGARSMFDVRRLWRAAGYTLGGLRAAVRYEPAFRLELALAVILIPLAFYLRDDGVSRALMVGSVVLVLAVELINSAIEAAVNRISLERHELAGRAKDIGSAAVFVSIANAAAVWLIVLLG